MDGRLPGDADKSYADYADQASQDLFSTEAGPARPGMGRIMLAEDGREYIRDANGYPVLMGDFGEQRDVLTQPNEIWQARGVTRYIRVSGDQVRVLSVESGKATELQTFWKDEYNNQGRNGFQEL
jgi:hypothetical protein